MGRAEKKGVPQQGGVWIKIRIAQCFMTEWSISVQLQIVLDKIVWAWSYIYSTPLHGSSVMEIWCWLDRYIQLEHLSVGSFDFHACNIYLCDHELSYQTAWLKHTTKIATTKNGIRESIQAMKHYSWRLMVCVTLPKW